MDASDVARLAAALSGPGGPSSPSDVYAAALALRDLQANGIDVSPSFDAVRTCISDWHGYAGGPGMWSDNYSESEQDRDSHGPAILTTLLGVFVRHALARGDAAFMAGVVAGGHQSLLYDIAADLMERDEDLSPIIGPLVDHAIDETGSASSDSAAYDQLCGIQNFRSTLGRAPLERRHAYIRNIRRQLDRIRPRADWRPFVHDQLADVRRAYE